MAFGRDDVCEHGSLQRKCDSCALVAADKRVADLEAALRAFMERFKDDEDAWGVPGECWVMARKALAEEPAGI